MIHFTNAVIAILFSQVAVSPSALWNVDSP